MIRLIRLTGEQAAKYWPALSRGFLRSLPPGTIPSDVLVNNMLMGVMRRQLDCWVIRGERNGEQRQLGAVLTTVRVEQLTGIRTLLVYSLFTRSMLSDAEWRELFSLASQVAKKHKCLRIMAYSKSPSILAVIDSLGGDSEMRAIELEVK